jgi:hypothetical protein
MRLLDEIAHSRTAGELIGGRIDESIARVEEAASKFGLSAVPNIYRQIAREEAVAVLANVIHKDMAYGIEIVSIERARALASAFVNGLPDEGTRYFTNGTFGDPNTVASWAPATGATFDTGVLALSTESTACVWFKDED